MTNAKITNSQRRTIIDAYNNGENISTISRILNLNRTTVSKIIKRYANSGNMERKTRTLFRAKKLNSVKCFNIKKMDR